MVSMTQVRQSNAQVDEKTIPQVAVFVTATSGISKATLIELVGLNLPITVYIVGRQSTEHVIKPVLDELRASNPKANLIWMEGEVSLLSETKRICNIIKEKESKIDLLFLTAGYAPFSGRNDTSEGLEVTHVLEYLGRLLFTLHFLPLLRASPHGRVITVLGGILLRSNSIDVDDPFLEKPNAFGGIASQGHMTAMTTLFLDRLADAEENKNVVFIHNWPGAVDTGNMARHWKKGTGWLPFPATNFIKPLFYLVGYSLKDSGERHLYMATSGTFGGKGPRLPGVEGKNTRGTQTGGLYLVGRTCETVQHEKTLKLLRETATDKIWKKTMEKIDLYL